jgi:DNA mismatch repair protein MutS2
LIFDKMIYPSGFEDKIGFATIRRWVAEKCISPLGVAKCEKMKFSSDFSTVRMLLGQTEEMLSLLKSKRQLPSDNIHDLTAALKSLQAEGSFLSATDLYRLRMSLDTVARIKSLFTTENTGEDMPDFPLLASLFGNIDSFPLIIRGVDTIVNKYGEISDNASPVLADIRRQIGSSQASLSGVMNRVVARGIENGVLEPGATPSMRDGRLVIPVAAGKKRMLSGIVHDESATGKTAYIEPVEVVEASNRVRELREREKREIQRILVEMADTVRPDIPGILYSFSRLGVYDFIRAKALFALDFDAQMPALETECEIDWYGAIHPVLAYSLKQKGESVVPLNLHLDRKDRILIISGPNAGGKSVCLKTAGIIQYMLQCGLLPTMHSNSHVCVFEDIMIDIGDEQSIENDLSTYSSHLKNMKTFLARASSCSFILVDEMGTGTEPQIGGALAQAILSQLNKQDVMGIVTTHYQNLKTFAEHEPGFVNGAMLYDRQHMKPLFQLSIGNPGSSFALEIARKTGLPADVINDATSIVGSDYVNMDKYLLDLARDKRYWERKRKSIKEKEAQLDAAVERYEKYVGELKEKRKEIIGEARSQARDILAESNSRLERTILEIRTAQADKERTRQLRKELDEYKARVAVEDGHNDGLSALVPVISNRKAEKKPDRQVADDKPAQAAICVGDYVRMSKGGVTGMVLSISGKDAEVAFGALRTRINVKKLIKTVKPQQSAATQVQSLSKNTSDDNRRRQLQFKQEIDVRGMRADEALQAVAYFLDDAVQFSASRVRILHGTGTGALRVAVRRYLQSTLDVESFHDEDVRFGGAGITVVNLR